MVSIPGPQSFWVAKINREGFIEFRFETSQMLRREESKGCRETIDSLLQNKILNEQKSVNNSWGDSDHCSLCNKLFKRIAVYMGKLQI